MLYREIRNGKSFSRRLMARLTALPSMDTKDAGSLGGKARAKKLTKEQRSESARHAANTRHKVNKQHADT